MKIETLVDLINHDRGEWQGCSGSNCVEIGPRSGRSLYGAVTFESLCVKVNSKAFKAIPSKFWSREQFENEVAELSAADWMPHKNCTPLRDVIDELITNPTKADQVHQPKHYEVVPNIQAKEMIETILNSVLTKGMSPYQVYCLGNTLKYRLRAGKKDNLQQDIDKANEYVNMGWNE